MPKKTMEQLTESMLYLLMAYRTGPLCGIDAAEWIARHSGGRVRLGPATLYTLLAKFEAEGLLREIAVEGRKRTYAITERGEAAYRAELERLETCLADAASAHLERRPEDAAEEDSAPAALPAL